MATKNTTRVQVTLSADANYQVGLCMIRLSKRGVKLTKAQTINYILEECGRIGVIERLK